MRVGILGASLASIVAGLGGRAEGGESPSRQTVEGLKELSAPVTGAEVRCDVSILGAARYLGDGRAGIDVELAPGPDHWYGLGAAAIVRTTTTTTTDAAGGVVTTSETAEAVAISARFFKRIGPLVLSAGVVDGRGGAGLELRGFDDRVRLEVLASNWLPSDPRAAPRLRVGGSVQWWVLYAQAGTLDVTAGALDNAFVGVGMRWTDPDLLSTLFWVKR